MKPGLTKERWSFEHRDPLRYEVGQDTERQGGRLTAGLPLNLWMLAGAFAFDYGVFELVTQALASRLEALRWLWLALYLPVLLYVLRRLWHIAND